MSKKPSKLPLKQLEDCYREIHKMPKKPICFTFTAEGVAAVFLRQRAPGCTKRDAEDLGKLIESAFHQGIYDTIEMAKSRYRNLHAGGCRIYSEGDACNCFLCQMDDAAEAVGKKKE